jgi:DNA-binding response OmpR family regulator
MVFRILYVEDEEVLGALVHEALEKAGYEVNRVTNGVDVWGAFKQFRPHICLFDIMLPGKNGYDVARQIRSIDSRIPIIFLTAKIQSGDVVAGFEAGCNDYIRKPFNVEELKLRIATWITERYSRVEGNKEKEIGIDGFMFLPDQQILKSKEKEIKLSYKESAVLSLLYQHRNNIIGRDYLLQKVWGTDTIYNSRSLDVYITRLRKYFLGTMNNIVTLRGIGYRFLLPEENNKDGH